MPDIGSKIRQVREEKGLSRKAFGELVGISEPKVQAIEIGKQRVDHETLALVTRSLGIDANWLLSENDENQGKVSHTPTPPPNDPSGEFVAIPRFDVEASAGFGSLVEAEVGSGYYAYNRAFLERRGLNEDHLSVISVSGDSMEPELSDRDLILIATDQKEPRNGFMFAVYYDGQLFVKRVQRLPGNRLHLISANERYPPIIVDLETTSDVRLVGRVVASMHEW